MNRKLVFVIVAVLAGAGAYCLPRTSPATDNIKPDYSPNRTIKDAGESVTVNFGQCTPDQRRIDVGLGSTFIVTYCGHMSQVNTHLELICKLIHRFTSAKDLAAQ